MRNESLKLSWEDVGSLDPISSTKTALHIVLRSNLYDCLFKRDYNGAIKPQLCKSWKWKDNTILEIELKKDIKFHNGKSFDAESVEYTFYKLKSSRMNFLYESIETINVINPNKIQLKLNQYDASLVPNLTILPLLAPVNENQDPIGTGPYRFAGYKNGDSLDFISNDQYWDGLPCIHNIHYLCCNDPYQRYDSLLSGKVDLIFQPPHEYIESLGTDYRLQEIDGPDTIVVSINCQKEYFDDNVRNAINLAIDREKIIKDVFFGHALVPKSVLSPPVSGYNPKSLGIDFNLGKAKELMELSAYKNGFECSLILPGGAVPKLMETATILKESLSKLNISVDILDFPEKDAWPLMSDGKYDMFINGWSEITLDPDYNLKSNFLSDNRENLVNKNLFESIDKVKRIIDEEERFSAYQNIQENLLKIQSRIPVYHAKDVWVYNKNIEFKARHDRLIDLKNIKTV